MCTHVLQLIGTSIGVMISVGMFFVVLDLDKTVEEQALILLTY